MTIWNVVWDKWDLKEHECAPKQSIGFAYVDSRKCHAKGIHKYAKF